jgi:hypothetical protein
MAMDFAIIGSFVRSGSLRIRFVRWTATLLYDSRRRPCASLMLHHDQAGWEEHHLQTSDQPPSRPKAPHEAAPIVSLGKENREGGYPRRAAAGGTAPLQFLTLIAHKTAPQVKANRSTVRTYSRAVMEF